MANYAVIKDNVVSNIIVAESKEIAESVTGLTCVETDPSVFGLSVGWTYNGTNFSAPEVE